MDRAIEEKLLKIEGKLVEHPFPPQLVVESTSRCNQQCIHCSHRELVRPKAHMTSTLWEKIVAEVGRESPDTEIWPTFYGEALVLGDEIWDRIDRAGPAGAEGRHLSSGPDRAPFGPIRTHHRHSSASRSLPRRFMRPHEFIARSVPADQPLLQVGRG